MRGDKIKDKICLILGYINKITSKRIKLKLDYYESFILIILFVFSEIMLVLIYLSLKWHLDLFNFIKVIPYFPFPLLKNFGFLAFISIPPLAYLGYWAFRTKKRILIISFFLGIIIILLNAYVAYCNYRYLGEWCCEENENYLPIEITLLFSIFYGIISINSCFVGLNIPRKSFLNKNFSFLGIISIFISISIVIYFSFTKRTEGSLELQTDPFLISFIFLILTVSLCYVMLGYFSQDEIGTPNPLIFMMSVFMCFSIGTTFSVFILQFERAAQTLISHWTFFCIWSLFLTNIPIFILKNEIGMSKCIKWFINQIRS